MNGAANLVARCGGDLKEISKYETSDSLGLERITRTRYDVDLKEKKLLVPYSMVIVKGENEEII